jgi:hypothetical protein
MPDSETAQRRAHYENFKTVNVAVTQSERATKLAIRQNATQMIGPLTLAQLMLVGVKAEARLMKLLYLPNGFNASTRAIVMSEPTILGRWKKSVEIGYRLGFSIPAQSSIENSLLHDDAMRFATITRVLDKHVEPLITARNRLAHGQWARPFNSEGTAVDSVMTGTLRQFNALQIQRLDAAVQGIANTVGDLLQSRALFQSRFNRHFVPVQVIERPTERSYDDWAAELRSSHIRGLAHIQRNLAGVSAGS